MRYLTDGLSQLVGPGVRLRDGQHAGDVKFGWLLLSGCSAVLLRKDAYRRDTRLESIVRF